MMAKKQKKQQNWRRLDPNFSKEKEKYGNPAPSREFIIDYLNERGMTLSWRALSNEWGLNEHEAEALDRRLKAMERDGELIRNRRQGYGVITQMELIKGRVIGHPEGYGFLHPEDGSEDLYISPRQMRQLLHGDRVVMRLAGVDRRGRREATLVEILERNTLRVVGRFFRESGIGFVVPDNRRMNQDVMIPTEWQNKAKPGQIVIAELIEQPTKRSHPIGRITEILGDHMAPGMEIKIAIFSHDIPTEWPPAVDDEIAEFETEVPESAKQDRVDLRSIPLVTIDGIDARDFDDAVYCEKRGNNWRLLVAIADVSWYVRADTALDEEAQNRGTSVYFPDRVIPMLPEALSNGLCSLNPEVDRLCLVCDMTINANGKIIRSKFCEAVMHSHARLTYETVGAILEKRDRRLRREYKKLVPHLDNLYELYQVLRDAREQRGTIDFDTQATVIEYDSAGKIERIVPSERNDAHRLIEECMISANIAAARFLRRHKIPALYRVHQGPNDEKLERLRGFLGQLGLYLGGGDRPTAKDCAQLLEQAKKRADFHLIQTVLLRSLSQAVYSPDNVGHFGLALENYTHFTSPIRRYPDLLVHRAIRHILQGGNSENFTYNYADMIEHGEHTSMTERRADDATRDAVEWLKCEYMLNKVGEVFDGIISGVTAFGLFVELEDVFVEGLLHVTSLPNDYYHFDPVGHSMRGKRTGKTYRLGDPVRIIVARVDLDERKIDFEVAQPAKNKRKSRKKTKTKTK